MSIIKYDHVLQLSTEGGVNGIMVTKKCSIIIPTKDKNSRLKLTLKGLENQVDQDMEVIVVFDGCRPETISSFAEMKFAFEPIKVISETNIGRAAARNKGLERATGDVIIFVDDDRIPAPDFVSKHLARHEEECVVLGERMDTKLTESAIEQLCNENDFSEVMKVLQQNSKKEFYYNIKKMVLKNPYHPLRYIGFITGNVSVDKSLLDKVGGFDPNFTGWGYEDTDLGYRLAKANVKYIADYTIVNYHIMHERNKAEKSKEELRNLRYFANKFRNDKVLQRAIVFYRLKATLRW